MPGSRSIVIDQVAAKDHTPSITTAQPAFAFGAFDDLENMVKDRESIPDISRIGLSVSSIQLGQPTG